MPAAWRPEDGMDCLSVNVRTPGGAGDRLPVMVWIYGGGWKSGHCADPGYDGEVLARGGVVMVTFNYRVGFEGFGYVRGRPPTAASSNRPPHSCGCTRTSRPSAATRTT
ncbi:carboxylesterase family protein [Streptomyces sp. NPDC085929]|uniref:carboxylesterase family protein n=1 Tax=Streptomyces sp. NPDC085929 TaxID=3365739 RepID=UPI0037D067FE